MSLGVLCSRMEGAQCSVQNDGGNCCMELVLDFVVSHNRASCRLRAGVRLIGPRDYRAGFFRAMRGGSNRESITDLTG